MPDKHRELARMVLHTGAAFMEVGWDPTVPRRIQTAKTKKETTIELPPGTPMSPEVVDRNVPVLDEQGNPVMDDEIEYGDIVANIVSPFSFHTPAIHRWNGEDMGWVLKEEFYPIDTLKDKYLSVPKKKYGLTKDKGWNLEVLKEVKEESVTSLAMWWYERISELVEGPGPSIYIGSPDYWEGYTVVRTFDRKPSPQWPSGRKLLQLETKFYTILQRK